MNKWKRGNTRKCVGEWVAIAVAAALMVSCPAARAADDAARVRVLEDTGDRIVLQLTVDAYTTTSVEINGHVHLTPHVAGEPLGKVQGTPELPRVCRSVAIAGDARMSVRVLDERFTEIDAVNVAPSKGNLPRTVNPKDVPYAFGAEYQVDALYPPEAVTLGEPYLLRRQRGIVVEFHPFRYQPVTRTLRVYQEITVEIVRTGVDTRNVLAGAGRVPESSRAFSQILGRHFVNYAAGERYTPLEETGSMLIIAPDTWIPNVQPLAAHRTANGIPTTVVGVSTIGNTATAIKTYIQNLYNSSDLAFVLLVGDSTQVATPSASGGSSDPTYAKVSGTDNYPDILVGRFSAETAAHVDTQVARTIHYEQTPVYDQPWFRRATGVASTEGPGDDDEYDNEHMDNIRLDLLAYGYTSVDQFYGYSATAAQVASALNAGRGLINYTGHGSTTSWSTTGFSVSDVNNLTNVNMLPFIFDVACVNGQFAGYTCFAEAWLRATYNGQPTGAIGIYASSINQSWDPPMCAQDESVDLLVAEGHVSFGALCFAGSCQMMDEYGAGGVEMFDTWHVFGDPAVKVRFDGPYAPQTADVLAQTDRDTPINIRLNGSDRDNDPLDFIITAQPAHGALADPAGVEISSVPYVLQAHGDVVRYTPEAGYIGDDAFTYKVNDGTPPPAGGDSNESGVYLVVRALPPQITTALLPDAAVDYPYGPVKLDCIEGQPPLTWTMVTDVNYLEECLNACDYAEAGAAQGWQRDDGYWIYQLPFAFPFYGQPQTEVRVWSNGFLNFGPHVGSSYNNSTAGLIDNARIAPLWDDLRTNCEGCDIHIDTTATGQVTFRWSAITYSGSRPVNFAVTLYADGSIGFDYGAGNDGVTATVGVSAGDGARYTLTRYDGVPTLTYVDSLELTQPNRLPPAMQVSADGFIGGVPEQIGEFEPVFRVCDSLGRFDEALIPMRVVEFAAGDCDFDADGAVDLRDFAAFQRCFTGAGQGPVADGCEVFRADPDTDIDLDDYAYFCATLDH